MEKELLKLLNLDTSRAVADSIVQEVDRHPDLLAPLVRMSFSLPYPASMRAARAIQIYCEDHPAAIIPFLDEIITGILDSKIEGIRRNYLKVLAENVDLECLEEAGPLISRCFDWLLDPAVMPATRIFAAEVIGNYCKIEPELKHELIDSLEFAMEECPVSLKCRGKRILARMRE